jgi:hypothetical protein
LFPEEPTHEIDLVKEPQEWINGFDAGFNNRPFLSSNTPQYCKGYSDGQHAWQNPVASPSLSSTATESSSLTSLYSDCIDPRLLDLDASGHDDVPNTPTQLTVGTCLADMQSNFGECDGLPLPSLVNPFQSITHAPKSHAQCPSYPSDDMYDAVQELEHLFDDDPSSFGIPLSPIASRLNEAFIPQRLQIGEPFQAHRASSAPPALTTYTLRHPIRGAQRNNDSMSTGVRWRLSMANHAQNAAGFFESQGNFNAAAAAATDATHWEKKARRRHTKNQSQNRIRAQQRAAKKRAR